MCTRIYCSSLMLSPRHRSSPPPFPPTPPTQSALPPPTRSSAPPLPIAEEASSDSMSRSQRTSRASLTPEGEGEEGGRSLNGCLQSGNLLQNHSTKMCVSCSLSRDVCYHRQFSVQLLHVHSGGSLTLVCTVVVP